MTTLFNYDPYNDDFDEDKNFMRVLFKPGFSVQARELTQLQTILSNQIERFGNHIFKSGSPIIGGKVSLDRTANYVIIQSQFGSQDIDASVFLNKTVVSFGNAKNVRARVIAVDTSTPDIVLVLKYLSGDRFSEGEDLRVFGQEIFATMRTTSATGGSFVASLQEGVYYFKGQFVKVIPQFLVVELFYRVGGTSTVTIKPSYKIGIEFEEKILDQIDDTTLLDPALGSFNYQAPGADRFKIETTLTKRTIDSSDVSSFFEVVRLVDDVKTKEIDYPVYSEIEKLLARRTHDESGNYTVDPFLIGIEEGDSANGLFNVVLDPGKAYVGGYEFQTIAPTVIPVFRARNTAQVTQRDIATNYESVLVIDSVNGSLDITSYPNLDLHCVPSRNVSTASAAAYNSTKIGTVNASMMRFNDATDNNLGTSHSFKVNVFNANTSPITGTLPSSGSTTLQVRLPTTLAPNVVNAYANMFFKITNGLGASLAPIRIVSSNSTTINLSSALTFIPASNTIQIQSDVKTTKSVIANTGSAISFTGNINTDSIDPVTGFTYINEPTRTSRIFDVPFSAVKEGTIKNTDFFARKIYSNRTSDSITNKFTITAEGTDTFTFSTTPGTISDELILNNIICFIRSDSVTNAQFAIVPGTVVSLANNNYTVTSLSPTTFEIDIRVPGAKADFLITSKINAANNSSTGTIRGKQRIPLVSGADLHAKVPHEMDVGNDTLDAANSTSRTTVTSGIVFNDIGATNFTDSATLTLLRTPGAIVSLQVPDVYEIIRITDSQSLSNNVTTAMLTSNSHDVTSRYEFDNGQRKTHYDHATIKLKRGNSAPRGRIFVQYKYLKHLSAPSPQNDGMFTVDSYLQAGSNFTYDEIFPFNNSEDSKLIPLRSAFDFRPTRAIGGTTLSGAINPEPLQTIETDFEYYLPRIDQIVVKPSKEFSIISGKPSLSPLPSDIGIDDMLIYTLFLPAYTESVRDIRADFKNHRRYTMRDIGKFDDRIKNLEYYVTLTALEKDTSSMKILDSNGLERSKYGIVVDNFNTKDVQASREEVGTDNSNLVDGGQLRPASLMRTIKLLPNRAASSATAKYTGIGDKKVLSLPYTSTEFAIQPYATKTTAIASALFAAFKGTTKLFPEFEGNVDTGATARVVMNSTQGLDNAFAFVNSAFKYISDNNPQFANDKDSPFAQVVDTKWYQTRSSSTLNEVRLADSSFSDNMSGRNWWGESTTTRTTQSWQTIQTTTDQTVIPRGAEIQQNQITTSSSQVDVGTFVTDLAIQPYMKDRQVLFTSSALRPSTVFFSFFDDINVTNYIAVPDRVVMNTASHGLTAGEQILTANTIGDLAANLASLLSGGTSYDLAYVSTVEPSSANVTIINTDSEKPLTSKFIYSIDSGKISVVSSITEHNSGVTRAKPASNQVTLASDAPSISIVGKTISFLTANLSTGKFQFSPGATFTATITAYNTTTKVATLNTMPAVLNAPTNKFTYSIGTSRSDKFGQVGGMFYLPRATFRSGQRTFRTTESFNNTYDSDAISFSDKVYTSSGITLSKTSLVNTVFNVDVNSEIVGTTTSDKVVNSRTSSSVVGSRTNVITTIVRPPMPVDPLAQTFFVDADVYPNGLFLESTELFFRAKDDENLPVRVQIRPTVNGIPSSDYWYPESVVTLYPNQVRVSETPSVQLSTTATRFTFSSPVFLKPGLYALVILTDSPDYVMHIAVKGGTTRNNEFISTQPYIGTLYKSQNTMEYVPFMNEDLMFRLNRCSFTTGSQISFVFENETQTNQVNVDKIRLLQNSIDPLTDGITTANYKMRTKFVSGSTESAYRDVIPHEIYNFGEDQNTAVGSRRRILQSRGDVSVTLDMSTTSNHISPIVSLESMYVNAWENFIDNAEISSDDFTIINGGSGYSNSNTVIITSATGSGATANLTVDANGNVIGIYVSAPGSGYLDDFSISYPMVGGAGGPTSNANIILNSEFDESGGPAEAKYITKPIVLADGFDAGDLRIFLAANKPGNSEISVYYKLLNSSDATLFKDRPYQKMICMNPSVVASRTSNEFTDFEFRPNATLNSITYTSENGVTYDSFGTFSIKIVMTSSDPSIVSKVKDLRIIALPAD